MIAVHRGRRGSNERVRRGRNEEVVMRSRAASSLGRRRVKHAEMPGGGSARVGSRFGWAHVGLMLFAAAVLSFGTGCSDKTPESPYEDVDSTGGMGESDLGGGSGSSLDQSAAPSSSRAFASPTPPGTRSSASADARGERARRSGPPGAPDRRADAARRSGDPSGSHVARARCAPSPPGATTG